MRSKQFVKKLIVQFSENLKLHVYIWTVVWLCDRCVYYTNLRCIFNLLSGIVLNETSVLNIQWWHECIGFYGLHSFSWFFSLAPFLSKIFSTRSKEHVLYTNIDQTLMNSLHGLSSADSTGATSIVWPHWWMPMEIEHVEQPTTPDVS